MSLPRTPRLPWVLLGAMTTLTLGGPVAIGAVLRGGARPNWPPDRPVEWAALWGISGSVAAIMLACIVLAVANNRAMHRAAAARRAERNP